MWSDGLKACEACKSSKRKCTKQLPRCQRCDQQGLNCVYESRPRMIVYREDGTGTLSGIRQAHLGEQYYEPCSQGNQPPAVEAIALDAQPPLRLASPTLAALIRPSLEDLKSAWFLVPDAWEITPVVLFNLEPLSTTTVHGYLDKTKDWLRDWIRTGSNPFVHAELYSKSMPDCICDTFMALSTYLSMTDKTASTVHHLIEQKANRLVDWYSSREHEQNVLKNIGRVHSLLIYSIIRLFDCDIRQRHLAEQHLPILLEWTKDMLSTASNATVDDTFISCDDLMNYSSQSVTEPPAPFQFSPEQLLWRAWVLSESVRRTWSMSMAIQSSYELLKTGMTPCHGGVRITTRKGVWDAETAFTWTKMCAEKSVGFVHRNDTEWLMSEMTVDEVDMFSLSWMEIDAGPDRMERWRHGNAP